MPRLPLALGIANPGLLPLCFGDGLPGGEPGPPWRPPRWLRCLVFVLLGVAIGVPIGLLLG